MDGNWIEFDTITNAVDNLEMIAHFLLLPDANKRWKWTIIAMHQSLYSFAILAIRGTNNSRVVKPPKDFLISIDEAVSRTKNTDDMPWANSIPLQTSLDEDQAIKKLVKEFRNGFEHFVPKTWTIEVSDMPLLTRHIMRVVGFLALESNCITYFEIEQKRRIEAALTTIGQALNALTASNANKMA